MRIYINDNETDFEKLAANVASSPRAAAAVRARLETLNPQFSKRVPKGAALVLPDGPDIKASAGTNGARGESGRASRDDSRLALAKPRNAPAARLEDTDR